MKTTIAKRKIDKAILGVAGEYYVAAELGKRNVYAQLTLGNQKRVDLIIFHKDNSRILKIEVKSKQGSVWPNVLGINEADSFIVFVDFKDICEYERPDFFVLSNDDWRSIIEKEKKKYELKYPNRKIRVENNSLIYVDEVNKYGNPYKGLSVSRKLIEGYKENWQVILKLLKR